MGVPKLGGGYYKPKVGQPMRYSWGCWVISILVSLRLILFSAHAYVVLAFVRCYIFLWGSILNGVVFVQGIPTLPDGVLGKVPGITGT